MDCIDEMDEGTDEGRNGVVPEEFFFRPLDPDLVREEMQVYFRLEPEHEQQWERECSKYEEAMDVVIDGVPHSVPRRNYANAKGVVEDPTLYPYHSALYPLLDAYDCLYEEGQQPIEKLAVPPSNLPISKRVYRPQYEQEEEDDDDDDDDDDIRDRLEGYTPVSVQSTLMVLVQEELDCWDFSDFFRLLQQILDQNLESFRDFRMESSLAALEIESNTFWAANARIELIPTLKQNQDQQQSKKKKKKKKKQPNAHGFFQFGHIHLPCERRERSSILLKLLQHSLSELQRDLRLASATVVILQRNHDFDDPAVLRELLSICCSEYKNCDGDCEWGDGDDDEERSPDHYCFEMQSFHEILVQVLALGVTFVTQQHAQAFSGFVRYTFSREFGHLLEVPEKAKVEDKRKILLKRNALARRAEDDGEAEWTSSKKVPVDLISDIICALGLRASQERKRLLAERRNPDVPDDVIQKSLDSFHNCLRALVDIAEAAALYLPGSERFYPLASACVRVFVCVMAADNLDHLLIPTYEEEDDDDDDDDDDDEVPDYFGLRVPGIREKRICSSSRFADCITNATDVFKGRKLQPVSPDAGRRDHLVAAIERFCLGRPCTEIIEAVKRLFVRDLVGTRDAGCGYGDFLVWCRLDCNPLDSVLFCHEYNYPVEEDDEDSDDEDTDVSYDNQDADWDRDEEDHKLTRGELRAWHDFSLVLLLRAWHAPWTPESHMSFQPGFRSAAETVMLATHRNGMPHDVGIRIIEFMSREHWPDERMECWSHICCLKSMDPASRLAASEAPPNPLDFVRCPTCEVATYCSEECRKTDYKVYHKKYCNVPPCRKPTFEENLLISKLTEDSSSPDKTVSAADAAVDVDIAESPNDVLEEADDDDWEDIDSDDEEESGSQPQSRTKMIYKFFRDQSYTPRGIGGD